MGRRRPTPEPDADTVAALEDAEAMVAMTEYMFRLSEVPEIRDADHGDEEAMRKLIAEHPECPLGQKALHHLDIARGVREEALHGQA